MPTSIDNLVSDYLEDFNLSNYSPENATQADDDNFDWVETIAAIKRNTNLDVIIGFDIVSDPIHKTRKTIKIGFPNNALLVAKQKVEAQLYKLSNESINVIYNISKSLLQVRYY